MLEIRTIPELTSEFDSRHLEIIRKYSKEIPKPNPELKVTMVIPAHAELDNGHFWKLLESLSKQSNFDIFEILYVVNTPHDMYKKLDPTIPYARCTLGKYIKIV